MKRSTVLRVMGGILIIALLISTVSLPAKAQDTSGDPGMTVESSVAYADAPVQAVAEILDSPPQLTEEQAAQLSWAEENTHLSPAVDKNTETAVAGPVPGTESGGTIQRPRSGEPLAPGDAQTFIWTQFGGSIPDGYKSNIMESSTDGKGWKMFSTGNWFAARSVNKGTNWTFMNPFTDYPEFCCDQVVNFDFNRGVFLWLRQGVPSLVGGNYQNTFKLSVSFNEPFSAAYWTYTFTPTNTNGGWTNMWWDYPHVQLGADYMYISYNLFNQTNNFVRTVMLRFPLDALAAGAGFGYSYYSVTDWFTFVPVSGADHVMYFASNWDATGSSTTLQIWRWYEDSGSLTFWNKDIPDWTPSGRGSMHCGSPNWLARADMRVLTGARYEVNNDGIAESRQTGRKVLGWWWNVAEGGGFTYPYVEGAAFYEDTMTLLPGFLGRPYIYGGWCFAYPSMAPDDRGDLGAIFNFSYSPDLQKPSVAYSIADDYFHAPPGWDVNGAAGSNAGSSTATWGDYNTVRTYQNGTTWIAATHYIPGAVNCSNCSVPLWFSFGRERDSVNFRWW